MTIFPEAKPQLSAPGIPETIQSHFIDASACLKAGMPIPAAIMARCTLEELSHSEGVEGNNLGEKIDRLKLKVSIHTDFQRALHDIRFLGNDVAHVECREFSEVTEEEFGVTLDLINFLFSSIYRYRDVAKKLHSLKKK